MKQNTKHKVSFDSMYAPSFSQFIKHLKFYYVYTLSSLYSKKIINLKYLHLKLVILQKYENILN